MKTTVIMQPTYLPWLGYFNLIKCSDTFVFLDSAQFEKRSWQQRNRIRNKNGEILLTIPVHTKGKFTQSIHEVMVDKTANFSSKHLRSLSLCYGRARNFEKIFPELESVYKKIDNFDFLLDIDIELIMYGIKKLHIKGKKILYSSTLGVKGTKTGALVDICKKVGTDVYLSPIGSKNYIDKKLFSKNKIDLRYHEFTHPVYPQIDFNNFIDHLSFVDFLFNFDDDSLIF